MDKISFVPFFLQSFPESLVITILGLAWVGSRPGALHLAAIAALTTVFSFVVRLLPIVFGTHSLLQLLFMVLLVRVVLKHAWKTAFTAVVLGITAMGMMESLLVPLWIRISSISMPALLSDPWLRVLVPLPHIFLLGMLALVSIARNWVIIPLGDTSANKDGPDLRKGSFLLLVIVLLQTFVFVALTLTFYALNSGRFPTPSTQSLIALGSVTSLIAAGTTIVVAYIMQQVTRKEAQLAAETRNLQAIQDLYLAVRTQRHDFLNHVTSIHGFLKIGDFVTAKQYMETLYQEVKQNQAILNLRVPALSGLLQAKSNIAGERGVEFRVTIDPGFSDIPLNPVELTGIVGNLVDNALDAVLEHPPDRPLVRVELLRVDNGFTISVTNTGHPLAPDIKNKIFTAGFTTKKSNLHYGLGLTSVQVIVQKYGGRIEVREPDDLQGVRFVVFIPQRTCAHRDAGVLSHHPAPPS
ncbi:hypothetical protein SY88_18580 [Clostridiales bacterium PH28_bin88]|nr:hypothetical protein SY88_18580 [Clostridiales bacterium PH28_bin88]